MRARAPAEWIQHFDRTVTLHVRRAKNGKPAAHPIRGDELRALRRIEWHKDKASI
jgi:hypothetical protein